MCNLLGSLSDITGQQALSPQGNDCGILGLERSIGGQS
jgi:hypothetical protein